MRPSIPTFTLQEVLGRLSQGEVTLLEALPVQHFEQGHLPGASRIDVDDAVVGVQALGLKLDKPIIVYCTGPDCSNSRKAAQALASAGYGEVAVFAGGKEAWLTAGKTLEVGHADR